MIYAYIGTFGGFTGKSGSEGIYVYAFDPATGALTHRHTAKVADPSYIALAPSRRTLYAASRGGEIAGRPDGVVVAYAIDPTTGGLTRLNEAAIPPQPAYISLDHTESLALVACTFGGAVASLPVGPGGKVSGVVQVIEHEGRSLFAQGHGLAADGRRRPYPGGSPFPHSIRPTPDNRFVLVPDLGLNRVVVYRLDAAQGRLLPHDPAGAEGAPLGDHRMTPDRAHWESPRGAGPRHLAFHPNGHIVYVVNELGSTVSVYDFASDRGVLTHRRDISTLPDDFRSFSITADIHVHPSGRFLYASNRGHDSLAIFALDESGDPTLLGFESTGGRHPRNFAFSPDGRLLLVANLYSNSIVVFEVDEVSGRLRANGTVNEVPAPSCITFLSG